jgi:hypothetical protein
MYFMSPKKAPCRDQEFYDTKYVVISLNVLDKIKKKILPTYFDTPEKAEAEMMDLKMHNLWMRENTSYSIITSMRVGEYNRIQFKDATQAST